MDAACLGTGTRRHRLFCALDYIASDVRTCRFKLSWNELRPLSPALARAILPVSAKDGCMRMVCSKQGGGALLLRCEARSGSYGHLAFGLIRHLMPEQSHGEIKAVVALRIAKRGPAVEVAIGSKDVGGVVADSGADEEAAIHQDLQDHTPLKKLIGAAAGGKPGWSKDLAQPVKRSIDLVHESSAEYARSLMPKIAEVRIAKSTHLHSDVVCQLPCMC